MPDHIVNDQSRIERLGEITVNQIAAGEVVERPVSVVKELIENALDAGSDRIKVSARDGGLSMIRVTDNGAGIDSRDLPLAVERHATSKLRNINDLENLSTLGFRGEALASVASVSRMEIQTRRRGETAGYSLTVSGADQKAKIEKTGCPEGTQVTVEHLFYNTPARLKFMKTAGYEGGLIHELIIQLALGYPEVGFIFENNGKIIVDTNEINQAEDLIGLFYGKEAKAALVPVRGTASKAMMSGWISAPPFSRGTRKAYHVFINGRWISVKDCRWPIEKAFEYTLPKGRFPVCVLHFRIPASLLDVNVHPGKLEVRINDPGFYPGITSTLRLAISGGGSAPELELGSYSGPGGIPGGTPGSAPGNSSGSLPGSSLSGTLGGTPVSSQSRSPSSSTPSYQSKISQWETLFDISSLGERALDELLKEDARDESVVSQSEERDSDCDKTFEDSRMRSDPVDGWGVEKHNAFLNSLAREQARGDFVFDKRVNFKVLGQLKDTFILAQTDEGLLIADQHVVHERIIYEELLKRNGQNAPAQMLIKPIRLDLTTGEEECLIQNIISLSDSGLVFERFGPRQYLLRSEPAGYSVDEIMIRELLETLDGEKKVDPIASARQALMIMSACKAAVKANTSLTNGEMTALLRGLRETMYPMTCPHGRPIMYLLPYKRLIQAFGRA